MSSDLELYIPENQYNYIQIYQSAIGNEAEEKH